MPTNSRDGLVWDDSGLDLTPRWASEPNIEAIQSTCRRVLQLDASDDCSVSFKAAGGFNRVYIVEDNCERRWIFRISLPVDPRKKTTGEVATLCWLERHSDIPAPRVVAFDDSSDNEIGYEWILMDLMPGTSAHHRWRKMSMEAKTTFVEKIAEYQAQIFNASKFRAIGTLKDVSLDADSKLEPGQLVALMFFTGARYDFDVPRGPFRSSHDWLKACISIMIEDQKKLISEYSDSDSSLDSDSSSDSDSSPDSSSDSSSDSDKEYAKWNLEVAELLLDLLPDIFPKVLNPPERTVLLHDDLSLSNILVDDDGAITAVLDWECVSTVPLWAATQMPQFLIGVGREDEPDRDSYRDADPEMEAQDRILEGDYYLESEGKNPLYWEHLMEYEQTKLRKVYSDRLSELCPAWAEAVADSGLKRDFYEAILRCDGGWWLRKIDDWVGEIWEGEFPTMAEMMQPSRT